MPRENAVIDLLVKIVINAIAVVVAVLVVPQIAFPAADNLLKFEGNWWHVLVVALILALINSYVKPILKALSFPITLLTMGLFAFLLNAALLLLVAVLADAINIKFTIGGFPPSFTSDTVVGALLGSIVISVVSIVLGMLDRGRRIVV
jgi:putative membrane protein